ncbi:MAG: hypothetical protein KDA65_04240 [Planctomycetaceae bacterium]|nr:hypothetical protein [Planctomycetaceae bacterium]
MGNSLAKRLLVYTLIILAVVGIASGLTWALTEASNPDFVIPETAKQVRNEHYDLALKVVDENGEPIRVARIKANWAYDPNKRTRYSQVFTNEEGMAYVDLLGDKFYYFNLELRARGYQTLYRQWGSRNTVDKKVELPKELTVTLPRGQTIGGVVVSQLGEPIIGAKVELFSDSEWHDDGEYYARLQESTPTDQEGRWELTNAPPEMNDLRIRVTHSTHLERSRNQNRYQTVNNKAIEQMKSKTHRLEMERGLIILGQITDENGTPVPDALVVLGRDPDKRPNENYLPRSDSNGNYKYKLGEAGSDIMTVLSANFEPQEVPVNVSPNMGPVNVKLKKGTPFTINVNGEDGKPLNDVSVIPVSWGENQCLRLLFTDEFPLKTNVQGTAVWENAPNETVHFWFRKDGLMRNSATLSPGEESHQIAMMNTKKIVITAVDAETGKSIPNFTVDQGYRAGGTAENPNYRYYGNFRTVENKFENELDSINDRMKFKVIAAGHKPAETPEIKATSVEGSRWEIEVKLEPGKGPTGRILTADGTPANGADVMLFTNNGQAQIYNGEIPRWSRSTAIQTNEKGEFQFDPQDGEFGLVALSPDGFLKLEPGNVPDKGDHQLKPWATVTGRLMKGTAPAVETKIALNSTQQFYNPAKPNQNFDVIIFHQAETDSNGTFLFERVPPGTYLISSQKQVPYGNRGYRTLSSGLERFTVEPSETKEMEVGGIGRPVKGILKIPTEIKLSRVDLFAQKQVVQAASTTAATPELGNALIKGFLNKLSDATGVTTEESAESTPEALVETPFQPSFQIEMNDDGSFQFDELPPGNYILRGNAYMAAGENDYGVRAGYFNHSFEVPEPAEGEPAYNSEPLDLGEINFVPEEQNGQFRSSF